MWRILSTAHSIAYTKQMRLENSGWVSRTTVVFVGKGENAEWCVSEFISSFSVSLLMHFEITGDWHWHCWEAVWLPSGYSLSFTIKKSRERGWAHSITRNGTLKPSQTTTNQPGQSYKDTLKSFCSPHDETASFKSHLLLPFKLHTDTQNDVTIAAISPTTIRECIDCNSKNLFYMIIFSLYDTLSTLQQTLHTWNEKTT